MSDEARERFEEWATESGWGLSRNKDGSYCTRTTDAAWGGFMAALKAQPVQEPVPEKKWVYGTPLLDAFWEEHNT